MATFRIRPGLRKSAPNPNSSRSLAVRRGARWRGRRKTIQLLLEQKILRDHRSHATGATQRRGHDGQVKQAEQEGFHARDSVGQTSGDTQRGLNLGFSERIGNSRRTGVQDAPCTDRGAVAEEERSPNTGAASGASSRCAVLRRGYSRGELRSGAGSSAGGGSISSRGTESSGSGSRSGRTAQPR